MLLDSIERKQGENVNSSLKYYMKRRQRQMKNFLYSYFIHEKANPWEELLAQSKLNPLGG